MKRKVRVRSAGGCLRAIVVLALLIVIAVLGARIIRSHISPTEAADGISDFIPDTNAYTAVNRDLSDIHRGDLLLVNADAPYHFPENIDLVSLYDYKSASYQVADKNVLVAREITEPLNRMFDDFYGRYHNGAVIVVSGYRSYDYQQTLLHNEIAEKGEAAYRWVAVPGSSEHHMGLAVDLGIYHRDGTSEEYDGTGSYAWINRNAYKYGFIVRYDESKSDITGITREPWHFRYVGIPHAYVIMRKGFCYEEYIDYLREFRYGKKHLLVTCGSGTYEIYYTRDTQVPVPRDKPYSISGNNVDGFIVTVTY
jgi:D-alanyl-D-alanine carboxypeptidase